MASLVAFDNGLNLKATELRLGLPGTDEVEQKTGFSAKKNKRALPVQLEEKKETKNDLLDTHSRSDSPPAAKAQIVGWPPVRSYRKNNIQAKKTEAENNGIYVKVSMDGAPYLRKIDIKGYTGYKELLKALEDMFKLKFAEYSEREGYKGSEYAPAYEDGDGDLMLVGDVPWEMFMSSCKRLRIMKGSEAKGLGCGV